MMLGVRLLFACFIVVPFALVAFDIWLWWCGHPLFAAALAFGLIAAFLAFCWLNDVAQSIRRGEQ